MAPSVALAACTCLVFMALVLDSKRHPELSRSLWVPVTWFAILCSRPVAQWFDPSVGSFGADPSDGNAFDRTFLSGLIALAALILARRRVDWRDLIRENRWAVALFIYFGLSVLWSDYPDVSFKRYVRAFGTLLIVLLILTERQPIQAISALVRRCGIVLIPFTFVLVKYYRHLAVVYNEWTGEEYLVGVTTDKNALGRLCLIVALFGVWRLISRHDLHPRSSLTDRLVGMIIFALSLWMLHLSKSSTSLACLAVGCSVLFAVSSSFVDNRRNALGTLALLVCGSIAIAMALTNLPNILVAGLGRNMTLTDRVFIWSDLLAAKTNPVFGTGYASFWLGARLDYFIQVHRVNEAHNGYIDVYVELGWIGLILFLGLIVATFFGAKRALSYSKPYARLSLAILSVFLVYNFTESAYRPTASLAFVFLLAAVLIPRRVLDRSTDPVDAVPARLPLAHEPPHG